MYLIIYPAYHNYVCMRMIAGVLIFMSDGDQSVDMIYHSIKYFIAINLLTNFLIKY